MQGVRCNLESREVEYQLDRVRIHRSQVLSIKSRVFKLSGAVEVERPFEFGALVVAGVFVIFVFLVIAVYLPLSAVLTGKLCMGVQV